MPQADLLTRRSNVAVLAAALALVPALARAQGTPEQQQACAPDAVRLCSATIPDIPKTTACMKAHVADLSPRCRTAFFAATGGSSPHPATAATAEKRRTHMATRAERSAPAGGLPPEGRPAAPYVAPDMGAYAVPPSPAPVSGASGSRANLAAMCREGLIDSFTCRTTIPALGLAD